LGLVELEAGEARVFTLSGANDANLQLLEDWGHFGQEGKRPRPTKGLHGAYHFTGSLYYVDGASVGRTTVFRRWIRNRNIDLISDQLDPDLEYSD
jgi:hypothetical protein